MKFLPIVFVAFIFTSCLNEDEQAAIQTFDSVTAEQETNVDTFIVAKGENILANETPEGDSLRAANDTTIENIRTALTGNQSSQDEMAGTQSIVKNPDVAPSFPGGSTAMDAYIKKNLIYPMVAFQNDITGTVNVRFVVEPDGKLSGVVVQKGIGYGCDESATDLIKNMPKWSPGKKAGVNVRCSVVLPITFIRPE